MKLSDKTRKIIYTVLISITCIYVGFIIYILFGSIFAIVNCYTKFDTFKSGYYFYETDKKKETLYIVGLTEEGKQQEFLIIPETIDGIKVTALSSFQGDFNRDKSIYGEYINFGSEKLKKIFVVCDIRIIYIGMGTFFEVNGRNSFEGLYYIPNNDIEIQPYYYRTSKYERYEIANVSYYYNYEESPNDGYYWIDNYDYGKKIEYIPQNPIREGYTFAGWYKEQTCENKWDFAVDTLPKAQYDKNYQEIYQELKLFAKWIKN